MALTLDFKPKIICTITSLIIGNDPTLTYLSFRSVQHCKVAFSLSYPLLLGGQQHLWRADFSEDCRSPMKYLKLALCGDMNLWSSEQKDYAFANWTMDLQCTTKTEHVMSMAQERLNTLWHCTMESNMTGTQICWNAAMFSGNL